MYVMEMQHDFPIIPLLIIFHVFVDVRISAYYYSVFFIEYDPGLVFSGRDL